MLCCSDYVLKAEAACSSTVESAKVMENKMTEKDQVSMKELVLVKVPLAVIPGSP